MTRDEILEAAAQIFSDKGYHAASMQNIAQAVNLQKASLYHHVSSKQEILLDLLDQGLDLLTARIQVAVAGPGSVEQRLRDAMIAYLQTLAEHRDLAAVLLLEHRSLSPVVRTRHIQRRDQFERLWRDLVQEGVSAGAFSFEKASLAAKALLGVMNWTITWYDPAGPLSPVEIANQFADLFTRGLLVGRPPAAAGQDPQ